MLAMTEKELFSNELLDKLAKLALLDLTDKEKEKYSQQLNDIITYFDKINTLDTDDIEVTTHPIDNLYNVFRKDIPWKSLTRKEALKNSSYTKDGFFKAPKILKE